MKPFVFATVVGLLFVFSGPSRSLSQDNPKADGWQTEAFASIVSKELTSFSSAVRDQNLDLVVARHFLGDQFKASYPEGRTRRRLAPPFEIVTSSSKTTQTANPTDLLAYLAAEWRDVDAPDFHFKVVAVAPAQSTVETKILVSVVGRRKSPGVEHSPLQWEQHSEWTASWAPSPDGSPRIAELHVQKVSTMTLAGSTAFVDLTSPVLGSVKSYHEQLAFGQPYWLRRIEAFHGMLNPGQNGISVADINGDGLDDLYVCQPGGLPNLVYLQQDNGKLIDASKSSGLDLLDNTHSALAVDLDNDGDQDFILATSAALLVYENNSGRFNLRHADRNMSDAYSLAASDFDKDGDLDLFACGYFPNGADVHALPIPIPYFDAKNGGANRLLRNDGALKFSDITKSVGLDTNNRRFSYAAIWIDFNNDGNEDLYVANDFGPDVVYRSERTAGDVQFVDVSDEMGIQHGAFGMSAAASDINRDGFEDIYVANMFSSAGNRVTRQPQFRSGESADERSVFQRLANGNSLLLNQTGSRFADIGVESGTSMGRWSWGSNFADINNDGWDDLLVTNGYITGETTHDL